MKKVFRVLISLSLVLAFINCAYAKNFELKLATIATPKDPWGQLAQRLGEDIQKNSEDTIVVTPYYAGKLGTGNDTIRQVARGRIDMGVFQLTDAVSVVKEMALLGTPFLFDSYEQRDCAMDKHQDILDKMFQKKGLKLIQYVYAGGLGFLSKDPILTPMDVKDIKMRSNQSNNSISFWESTGASTVPLPMVDFASSLQTGLVKGGAISPAYYVLAGFGKLAPHYTLLNQWSNAGYVLINLKKWNQMSTIQQKQIMASVGSLAAFRKQVRDLESMLLQKHVKEGGFVHYLTPEQRQLWKDTAVSNRQKFIDTVKGDDKTKLWDTLQKAASSCVK